MSNSTAQKPVTEEDAKTFYASQESLLEKAIKNLNVLDKQINRTTAKVKKFHIMIKKNVAVKNSDEDVNILKINMNIIKISLKAKKEQVILKKLNILRKAISEKMNELVEVLGMLKDVAATKGIYL